MHAFWCAAGAANGDELLQGRQESGFAMDAFSAGNLARTHTHTDSKKRRHCAVRHCRHAVAILRLPLLPRRAGLASILHPQHQRRRDGTARQAKAMTRLTTSACASASWTRVRGSVPVVVLPQACRLAPVDPAFGTTQALTLAAPTLPQPCRPPRHHYRTTARLASGRSPPSHSSPFQ